MSEMRARLPPLGWIPAFYPDERHLARQDKPAAAPGASLCGARPRTDSRERARMSRIDPQIHRLRSGEDLLIRCPTPADALTLCRYLDALWHDPGHFNVTGPGEVQLTSEQEAAWIQSHLEAPADLALVAESDGEMIGFVHCDTPPRRRLSHTATLAISIAAGWREQGIGRLLLQTALTWARAHPQLEKVWLTVIATNARAIHLYEALGFREEGRAHRAIKFEDGTYADMLQMYLWV